MLIVRVARVFTLMATQARQRKWVESRKRQLDKKIEPECLEPIKYFYRVIEDGKEEAEKHQLMKRKVADLIRESNGSPIDGKLHGVTFCSTLYRGGLPTTSPYGTDRLIVPIGYFLEGKPHLFFNSWHNTGGNNNYVVLVLVWEDQTTEYEFCCQNLIELDMSDNPYLQLNAEECKYSCHCSQQSDFRLWVEIFVVGDFEIPKEARWDTVINTGRHKYVQD